MKFDADQNERFHRRQTITLIIDFNNTKVSGISAFFKVVISTRKLFIQYLQNKKSQTLTECKSNLSATLLMVWYKLNTATLFDGLV